MKYSFYDDYSEGIHPELLKYITDHNLEQQLGYSNDEYCKLGADRIRTAFSLPNADVHFLPNGSITNVIGLVSMLKPFEGVISTDSGHINTHETGALEAAGRKILWVESPDGKLTPKHIDIALRRHEDEHSVLPKVVYLTQATELGTAYTYEELKVVVNYAKNKGLYTFLDGARLAMALANDSFGFTLESFGGLGIDMFYIGGTKNGGLYGEAMVITNDALKADFRYHIKQRGGLMAKGRFMGQQFARFFDEDNLWTELAKHANELAGRLYNGLKELGVEFDLESGTNQIFPIFTNLMMEELKKDYGFYKWQDIDSTKVKARLVCSWATPPEAVYEFLAKVKELKEIA